MISNWKPIKNRKSEKNRFSTFLRSKYHKNTQEYKIENFESNSTKFKTGKKPENREKSVFLLFWNSNTIKTGMNRLLRPLNSIKVKSKPLKNRMTVKNSISELLNIKYGDEWVFHSWFMEILPQKIKLNYLLLFLVVIIDFWKKRDD